MIERKHSAKGYKSLGDLLSRNLLKSNSSGNGIHVVQRLFCEGKKKIARLRWYNFVKGSIILSAEGLEFIYAEP